VLQFKIALSAPGIVRISFVHATDEFPRFELANFNDTPLVFVGDANGLNLQNFLVFRDVNGMEKTLSVNDLRICGFLGGNLVAPSPEALPDPSDPEKNHADVGTTLHFNHEYGGFTRRLTRERCEVLPPGTYTIKIVVQDATDDNLDSATFFEAGSLKLYEFLPADFNLDGVIDGGDFGILAASFGMCGKKFIHGDADGDGCVDGADYGILSFHFGATGGNRDLKFDYNRDNHVDGSDFVIWQQWVNTAGCASRFEGDSDGDGDVDGVDNPVGTELSDPCGGGGGEEMLAGGENLAGNESAGEGGGFQPGDVDHDGDVDIDDVELFGQQIADE
jgi:hypothetical protein